jgi:hypothetical protein
MEGIYRLGSPHSILLKQNTATPVGLVGSIRVARSLKTETGTSTHLDLTLALLGSEIAFNPATGIELEGGFCGGKVELNAGLRGIHIDGLAES